MKYKVAVVGGGPSGSCAAEILAECDDIDVTLFERKMDNAKPCGGAIPLCMIDEFDLPTSIIDRKVCSQCLRTPVRHDGSTTAALHSSEGVWQFRAVCNAVADLSLINCEQFVGVFAGPFTKEPRCLGPVEDAVLNSLS